MELKQIVIINMEYTLPKITVNLDHIENIFKRCLLHLI